MASAIDSVTAALVEAGRELTSHQQLAARIDTARTQVTDPAAAADLDALYAAFDLDLEPSGFFFPRGTAPEGPRLDVRSIATDIVDRWEAYTAAAAAAHPLVRARLHHLLHLAGRGGRDNAALAITAYRDAVPLLEAEEHGAWFAARTHGDAFRLAHNVRLDEQRNAVAADMLAAAERHLTAETGAGVVLELLEPLAAVVPEHERQRVIDVLERACDAYADNVHYRVDCLKVLRNLHPKGPLRDAVDERIVSAWQTAATTAPGFTKVLFLDEATSHARFAGLTELYDKTRLDTQRIGQHELEMTTIRLDLGPMPAMEQFVAAHVAAVDTAGDLRTALLMIGGLPAPVSDEKTAGELHGQLADSAGLLALTTLGLNLNGPVLTGHESDAQRTWKLRDQLLHMDILGMAVTAQLDSIQQKFVPDEYDLLEVLRHDVVLPEESAQVLAEAFQAYWLGMDRLALRGALPVVEGMLRRIVRRSVPIITPALGDKAGGVVQLGTLITKMLDVGFDPGWQTFMRLLLADPKEGRNLRNVILHDLQTVRTPRHQLALVLQTALFLLRSATEPDQETDRGSAPSTD